jgi:hypothetical protein
MMMILLLNLNFFNWRCDVIVQVRLSSTSTCSSTKSNNRAIIIPSVLPSPSARRRVLVMMQKTDGSVIPVPYPNHHETYHQNFKRISKQ